MEKSFPFNAVTENGVPDRVYAAEDFARERATYVSSGVTDGLAVTPGNLGGLTVDVSAGAACLSGYTYWNDGPLTLSVPAPDEIYPRRDRVVLRLDLAARTITAVLKKGLPAEEPSLPSLTQTVDVFELPLATVSLLPGQTEITDGNLTDQRPRADYILNPIEVDEALKEYKTALSDYFDGTDADALAAAANTVRTDKGADHVLCGDGAYRRLPETGVPLIELCRFTESGTFTPADYPVQCGLYTLVLQGGGGSGGRGTSHRGGSAGGYTVVTTLLPGESYAVTVGKGGTGKYAYGNTSAFEGEAGGATAFGPFSVPGGAGGKGSAGTPVTVGVFTAEVGTGGPSGKGGNSLFGEGGMNSSTGDGLSGSLGAGGGACSSAAQATSGAGGDGVVIVYGYAL